MHILAIDTSCDETSVAILQNDWILSNVVSSQVNLHRKWGGVVPDIARRAHKERIDSVIKEALTRARISLHEIDFFAATYGPGLAIALEVGLEKAKTLAQEFKKPLIPVNHMEGHLLSSFAKNSKGNNTRGPMAKDLPAIGILISGGHTEMIYMKNFGKYKLLGETLDDAAGEAFDKVAKMLDLGYPGGPIMSEFAKKGTSGKFELPVPMKSSGDLNFSYSGLKTACLYKIKATRAELAERAGKPQSTWVYDFAADFVNSVIESIILKLKLAIKDYPVKSVLLGGGVISNVQLRRRIRTAMKKYGITVYQPYSNVLFTDNAGMIGIAGYYMVKRKDPSITSGTGIQNIDRDPVATFC